MRINLNEVKTYRGCAKPGCKRKPTYRHHRGGEHTFVRHFALRGGKKYRDLLRRYREFRAEDCVDVCGDHHEEIHYIIWNADAEWMGVNGCIQAFHDFSWKQAEALIEHRRTITDGWLTIKTSGMKERKFTNYP